MTFLLDVNVLIALIDPAHIHQPLARSWFRKLNGESWATCPITQLGVLRIVGHPAYPNSPGSPAAVAPVLSRFLALPGHLFWPDTIDLSDNDWLNPGRILKSAHLTDSYLLALAVSRGGRLATLDRRLNPSAVNSSGSGLHVIA